MMQKSGSSQKFSRSQKQETFSANVHVVSRSRCPAESCRISYQWDKSQICPTMSSPHISTLPLILTSLATHLPLVTLATHSLTCLPSSSSIEVPSDGELEVQCNVTVPNTQVCFWVLFSLLNSNKDCRSYLMATIKMQEAFYTIQWVTNKEGMISNVSYDYICRCCRMKCNTNANANINANWPKLFIIYWTFIVNLSNLSGWSEVFVWGPSGLGGGFWSILNRRYPIAQCSLPVQGQSQCHMEIQI